MLGEGPHDRTDEAMSTDISIQVKGEFSPQIDPSGSSHGNEFAIELKIVDGDAIAID